GRGQPSRTAAWDRLSVASPRFRRLELAFSTIWGLALLAECAARLVGAYTLPVTTMVWLGTVMTLGSIGVAIVVGGAAAGTMQETIDADVLASCPEGIPRCAARASTTTPAFTRAAVAAASTSTPTSSAARWPSSPGNCAAPPCGSPAATPGGSAPPPSS